MQLDLFQAEWVEPCENAPALCTTPLRAGMPGQELSLGPEQFQAWENPLLLLTPLLIIPSSQSADWQGQGHFAMVQTVPEPITAVTYSTC